MKSNVYSYLNLRTVIVLNSNKFWQYARNCKGAENQTHLLQSHIYNKPVYIKVVKEINPK